MEVPIMYEALNSVPKHHLAWLGMVRPRHQTQFCFTNPCPFTSSKRCDLYIKKKKTHKNPESAW